MKRGIALWGLPEEESIRAVAGELSRRGVPHLVIDQRQSRRSRLDVSGIEVVFARPTNLRKLLLDEGEAPDSLSYRRALGFERDLFAWADMTPIRVINRPSAAASNGSKPYQAELIRHHGFEIPPTLVTTSPAAVREFHQAYGQVIYKSVSSCRSTVSRLRDPVLEALNDVVNCPTQFQAWIPGVDWRVHVIGDAVYACEIRCRADDYRMAHEEGESIEFNLSARLPPVVAMRCHALTRLLGLELAGIDLRRTEADAWYCFEVNPAPAFTWFERNTGQPLTAAVAHLLAGVPRSEAICTRVN